MEKKNKEFLSLLFLECVCEEDRNELFKNPSLTGKEKLTIEKLRNIICNENYSKITEVINEISNSKSCIIFQTFDGHELSEKTFDNDIVIIEKSDAPSTKCFEITRSELLAFYRNHDNNTMPTSSLFLKIKNSLKIVNVEQKQNDLIVQQYFREPCIISYIHLQFKSDSGKRQHVYMALAFAREKSYYDILCGTRALLSFRSDIVKRFKNDFRENKPALYADTRFRWEWLADKKAGDHMCDQNIDIISNKFLKNANDMIKYFNENVDKSLTPQEDMLLIANTHIARYFRRLVAERFGNFDIRSTDINDLDFSKIMHTPTEDDCFIDKIFFTGEKLKFNNYKLISTVGNSDTLPSFGGNSNIKTYNLKYLHCFLIDILNSMLSHTRNEKLNLFSNEEKRSISIEDIVVENDKTPINSYLVFRNLVDVINNDLSEESIKKELLHRNYELKQKIEFEKNAQSNQAQGISLGSLANFVKNFDATDTPLFLNAFYEHIIVKDQYGKDHYATQFVLKLPILIKGDNK